MFNADWLGKAKAQSFVKVLQDKFSRIKSVFSGIHQKIDEEESKQEIIKTDSTATQEPITEIKPGESQ